MNQTKQFGRYEDCTPYLLAPFGYPIPLFDDAVSVISEEVFLEKEKWNWEANGFKSARFFP